MQRLLALWATALAAVASSLVVTPTAADAKGPGQAAAVAAVHRPVIFVHGLLGKGPANFGAMAAELTASGWSADQVDVWRYDWTQSNVITAQALAREVDRVLAESGAEKVDLVVHSMGSLSSRYYLKVLGGTAKVAHWVSIGGASHGTYWAYLCPLTSCADLRPGSTMLGELNPGDETPGPTLYQTQSSTCDEMVIPHSSVPVKGAENIEVGCLEHIWMPKSPRVIAATRAFLEK